MHGGWGIHTSLPAKTRETSRSIVSTTVAGAILHRQHSSFLYCGSWVNFRGSLLSSGPLASSFIGAWLGQSSQCTVFSVCTCSFNDSFLVVLDSSNNFITHSLATNILLPFDSGLGYATIKSIITTPKKYYVLIFLPKIPIVLPFLVLVQNNGFHRHRIIPCQQAKKGQIKQLLPPSHKECYHHFQKKSNVSDFDQIHTRDY